MSLNKKIGLAGIAIGLVLATTVAAADIPPELLLLAQDLGCQTSDECAEKFDANIETGIALAQKYNIYTSEQEKVAITFQTEVLERLRTVSQDNFEEEILALANKILSEKPALARTMGVTRQIVNNAETIINTIKDAGVDIRTCQKSPEDLSREQLIACIKASNDLSNKEKSVGDYIPKGNVKAEEAERMLDLENSLLAGEYSGLGQIGVEQAGQVCLKPGSESITDCDRIAERFFGAEGLKHLQEARQQTTRIKEYYTEGIERMELVTPDGQKLIGKDAIKNACNSAFEGNNFQLARACGNFAVKNGYATEEEVSEGLKLLETFSQKAQGVNFNDCRFNPQSCREFLPDESRSQFDSQFEIFKIMSESIGFDPSRCENTYDPDIGKRCLEGAKKALSQVEEIAKNSPEARRIVDEIRSHITEGERMTERRDEFHRDSSSGGMAGPGGCRGPEECFKYCNQPANSAECISFGAKSQIFDQNSVVERFNIVNERNEGFDHRSFPNLPDSSGQFGQEIDPEFTRSPYPPQQPDQGFNRYPYPQQPVGPSPECLAAISSGDFAKAKIACSSTTDNYPRPIAEPFPVCPISVIPSPCPEDQMRQQASDARGCPTYGACVAIEGYRPIDTTPRPCPTGTYWDGRSCITQPITQCSSGQWWDPATQSCKSSTDTYKQCDWSIDYLKMSTNTCVARSTCLITSNPDYNSSECQGVRGATTPTTQCSSGQWWDPATQSCKSAVPTVGSCNYSTQYWKASTSQCQPRTNCTDTTNADYNSSECQGVRGMTQPVPSGCGSLITQATCQASPGCGWANGACGGNVATNNCPMGQWWNGTMCVNSSTTGNCPTGYHSHSESGGFCMNEQENYNGTCYNSAGTAIITCPQQTYNSVQTVGSCNYSTQYWKASTSQCMPRTDCYETTNSEYNSQECQGVRGSTSATNTTTCSSGQYWDGTACVATSTVDNSAMSLACATAGGTWNANAMPSCQMPTTTGSTSCTSGQYWNGSACVANPNTVDPGAACSLAGGTWNSSTNYCQMPTTTPSCPPEQSWNGSMCAGSGGSDPATMCAQAGGTWDSSTSTCQMAMLLCNQSGGNWTGAACNLGYNIADQKAYYSYFQKQPSGLLAQAFRAFADLFR